MSKGPLFSKHDQKMMSPTPQEALEQVFLCVGSRGYAGARVRFTGADPVFRTRFKVSIGGAAALGAVGLAMAEIRQIQTGERPSVAIDLNAAAASLRSARYVLVDGVRPAARSDLTGFYRAAHGRWTYFHCNHEPHLAAVLRVLGVPAEKDRVAAAVAQWDAFALEDAVLAAGGLAPAVRTPQEWRALPNTQALRTEPLVEVTRIGDSPPVPLPIGSPNPLTGLRVLDLTRVLAGPTCGRLLAESGADVLKITCEKHPDLEAYQMDTGYGKRKVTLDIGAAPGRQQFEGLLKGCDVFSQAYRPGALASLGFGPEEAMSIRPGIIYASLNAFGYSGEWKLRRGFDTVVQAACGMAHVSGDGNGPQFLPVSALDYIGGYLMTFGVLEALKRRHREGGSYAVNVSLARCAEWLGMMGLLDQVVANQGVTELPDIEKLLTEQATILGRLTRLAPVIRYSDERLNRLIGWPQYESTPTWQD